VVNTTQLEVVYKIDGEEFRDTEPLEQEGQNIIVREAKDSAGNLGIASVRVIRDTSKPEPEKEPESRPELEPQPELKPEPQPKPEPKPELEEAKPKIEPKVSNIPQEKTISLPSEPLKSTPDVRRETLPLSTQAQPQVPQEQSGSPSQTPNIEKEIKVKNKEPLKPNNLKEQPLIKGTLSNLPETSAQPLPSSKKPDEVLDLKRLNQRLILGKWAKLSTYQLKLEGQNQAALALTLGKRQILPGVFILKFNPKTQTLDVLHFGNKAQKAKLDFVVTTPHGEKIKKNISLELGP
jgi:hypothetical protein